ncbi:hypothetical protein [Nocardia sp. AG03]|uniref:hypothetical protein n=1 Tax=Nocardia sp. AG03 TaxID=3025312 RepID=UPI00241869C4|nr:hypothetical protein [Nocardia sp. AG03]
MTADGPELSLGGAPAPLIQLGGNAAGVAAAAAQQKMSTAQSRANATDQALLAKNAGLDANFVATQENFGAYSHADIYQHAQALNVEGLRTAHSLWSAECTRLSDLSQSLQFSLLGLMNQGQWQGRSGDAARAAVAALGAATRQIGEVFSTVSDRLDAAAWAAEATRLAVPPPTSSTGVSLDPDDPTSMIIPGLVNPETATTDQDARAAAENTARVTMSTIYAPSFPTTGDSVPAFSEAPRFGEGGTPVNPQGTQGIPASDTDSGGTKRSDEPSNQTPDPEDSPTTNPADNTSTEDSPSDTADTADDGSTSTDDSSPSEQDESTTPASTTPSGTQTGQPGAQSGLPQTTGAPGSAGSPGGTGSPAVGGQLGVQPTPGRPNPVPNTEPRTVLGGSPGSARAAGTSTGMGPMAGRGASARQGDDDQGEHRAPEYLRGVHPDWLAGTEAPTGVLGADAESAAPVAEHSAPARPQLPVQSTPVRPTRTEPEFIPPVSPTAPVVREDIAAVPAHPTAPSESAPAQSEPALSAEIASLLAQHGLPGSAQTHTPSGETR